MLSFMQHHSTLTTSFSAGGDPVEEDVDICGNASPILIEKDAHNNPNKCGSPSSSSSDSGSSSSGLCSSVLTYSL